MVRWSTTTMLEWFEVFIQTSVEGKKWVAMAAPAAPMAPALKPTQVNAITFEGLDAGAIRQAVLHTHGVAGSSGLDAFAWRCYNFTDSMIIQINNKKSQVSHALLQKLRLTDYIHKLYANDVISLPITTKT